MPEKKEEENQLQFLICPNCQGGGRIDKKNCPECLGLGTLAWTGNDLLYWSKSINFLQITQDKLAILLKNFIDLILFLFAVLGIIMLGWTIFIFSNSQSSVWEFYRFRTWQLFIFWLSALTDSYLIYRLQREVEKIKYIPKRKYEHTNFTFKQLTWA